MKLALYLIPVLGPAHVLRVGYDIDGQLFRVKGVKFPSTTVLLMSKRAFFRKIMAL
jgi:hypothetical protein